MCLYAVFLNGDLCRILAVIIFSAVLSTKNSICNWFSCTMPKCEKSIPLRKVCPLFVPYTHIRRRKHFQDFAICLLCGSNLRLHKISAENS